MELTLAQLARRGGVSARTVRYYIQRGLLSAPAFRGPDTCYTEEHLLGLQAIHALQAAHWPLDAISAALHGRSPAQLREIAAGQLPETKRASTDTITKPRDVTPRRSELRGARILLADGLELWVDDRASESVRQLARTLEEHATKLRGGGEP
ncbi:MAG: MerR family transcriptional regulator [Polyangiales bacterium]